MAKKRKVDSYKHSSKKRTNNPEVGLVSDKTDKEYGQNKNTYKYDPHLDPELTWDPDKSKDEALQAFYDLQNSIQAHESKIKEIEDRFGDDVKDIVADLKSQHKDMIEMLKRARAVHEPNLKWAGKAEKTSFEVPTVSLHVHERIDPHAIIQKVKKKNGQGGEQLDLFQDNQPYREAVDFYKHEKGWSNRLIAGDSLLVMNSLLEKEGMAGKVQMVYIDPPYGVSYGSNFQPFVSKRNVKDQKDEDLTSEPEMIKAFRDTWELGIHSYLTYLKDRLYLSKNLVNITGSVFVQISDENNHLIRNICDEVFSPENFISQINFRKSGGFSSKFLDTTSDYIVWYAIDKKSLKYRQLFDNKVDSRSGVTNYPYIELNDGSVRTLNKKEKNDIRNIPKGSKVFGIHALTSSGAAKSKQPYTFKGETYYPGNSKHWKAKHPEGMVNLENAKRLVATKTRLGYKRYFNDFPVVAKTNSWDDTRGEMNPKYVVQTSSEVIKRCILMSTDPGDLVFDPTCGSGTTAEVAEKWGRRWITCDTSRVSINIAKQRLLTSNFDYYELAHETEGIGSGFNYKTVPHITLKCIANDEPPGEEVLYDQPKIDNSKTRVTGPFTVESIPATMVKSIDEATSEGSNAEKHQNKETIRQDEWKEELLKTGVRGKSGEILEFSRVETQSGTKYIQARAETKQENPKIALICFGPEYASLEQRMVERAIDEAKYLKPDILLFCAFQFDDEAAKDIDETPEDLLGFKLLKSQMNLDLLTEDLRKKRSSNQSFWLIGQPDVDLIQLEDGKVQVEVKGFDYYNPKNGMVDPGGNEKIAMWLLDTDYNDRSLFPTQVFFPMARGKDGWGKLKKTLKAEIDQNKIKAFHGTKSLPFDPGNKIAVKIIDDRGIESIKILHHETN